VGESGSKVTWDRGIDFRAAERKILKLLRAERRPESGAYAAVLLIQ